DHRAHPNISQLHLGGGAGRAVALETGGRPPRGRPSTVTESGNGLITIVFGFVGSVDVDPQVLGLGLGKTGEADAELLEVEPGDHLVELLGQHGYLVLVL